METRLHTHPLAATVRTERTGNTLSLVCLQCDRDQYPAHIAGARLEVRWYTNDDYNFHYIETYPDDVWQCRWDRHQNPHTQRTHFHPPPNADSAAAIPDTPADQHPSAMLTRTLANIQDRIESLWEME